MPTSKECLLLVDKAVRDALSKKELDVIVKELEQVRAVHVAEGMLDDLDKKMAETAEGIVNRLKRLRVTEERRLLKNIIAWQKLQEQVGSAVKFNNNAALGLESTTVGVNTQFVGALSSVHHEGRALFTDYLAGLFSKVNKVTGLLDEFLDRSPRVELDIANELAHVQARLKPYSNNKKARQIAEVLDEVDRNKVATENRAGADIELRGFRVARMIHNRTLISKATFEVWSEFYHPLIDWKTMKVSGADQGKLLQDAYDELTKGHLTDLRAAQESDSPFVFTPGTDIAKQASLSRRIVYKTDHKDGPAGAWMEYNRKFGMKSFREAWMSDLKRSAENTALMRKFGHRPREMFDRLVKDLIKRFPEQSGELAKPKYLHQFKAVDGTTNIDAGETMLGFDVGAAGQETRAGASILLLGNAGTMVLLDRAIGMTFIRMFRGGGFLAPLAQSFDNLYKGIFDADTRAISDMMGLGNDVTVGELLTRFSSADNNSGPISRHLQLFFKLNILTPLTARSKRGDGVMLGKDLANLPTDWNALPVQWKGILGQYGIDARGWSIGRAAIGDVRGHQVLLPAEIRNVRGIGALHGLSERAQLDLLDDMRIAFNSFVTDITDTITMTSGARERTIFIRGLPRGSIFGEVARFISQFKGPPTVILTRVMGRQLLSRGSKTLRDAIFKGEGDIIGIAWLIAMLTVSAVGIEQMLQMTKLRKPRPFDASLLRDSFIRGGGGGLYIDFLFHESARYGTSATSALAGPSPSLFFDRPMSLRARMMAGQSVGPELVRFFRTLTPDFFYTQAAIDYLIFYQIQEMLNPGYLARMEQGFKSDRGQGFILPPSRVIPRGGGGLDLGRL